MKFNKYLICALFLVLICCIGAASAAEAEDVVAADDAIDEEVTEAVDVSDEVVDDSLGVSEEPALSDGEDTSSDEGYVIYVGHNNKTVNGNGSKENPFSNFQLACDDVKDGKNNVTINVYDGEYNIGSGLEFNVTNLHIRGLGDNVTIASINPGSKTFVTCEYFSLSTGGSFTLSDITVKTHYPSGNKHTDQRNKNPSFVIFNGATVLATFNNCIFEDAGNFLYVDSSKKYTYNYIYNGCSFIGDNLYQGLWYNNVTFKNSAILDNGKFLKTYGNTVIFDNCLISDDHYSYGTDYYTIYNCYAPKFSADINYLGSNSFEIEGNLSVEDGASFNFENLPPIKISLTSWILKTISPVYNPNDIQKITQVRKDIQREVFLNNGTFKLSYTSGSPIEHDVGSSYVLLDSTGDYDFVIDVTFAGQTTRLTYNYVNVSAYAPSISYGDAQNVTITFSEEQNGIIYVNVDNNKTYNKTLDYQKEVIFNIPELLSVGCHNITVSFIDSESKVYSFNTTNLTISKVLEYDFNATVTPNVYLGDNVTVTLSLPDGATGNVTVKVGDNEAKTFDINDIISIDGFIAGDNVVNITYNGDDVYYAKSIVKTIVGFVRPTTLAASDVTTTYNVTKELVITLTSNGDALANKKINVVVGSINKTLTTNASGQVSLDISSLTPNNYTANIAFAGDELYNKSSTTAKVTVKEEIKTNITIPEITAGKTTTTTIKLPQNATGNITVIVDGNVTGVENLTNGSATVTIPELSAGKHNITISYSGDANYAGFAQTSAVEVKEPAKPTTQPDNQKPTTVKKTATKITAKKKTFKAKKKVKKYTIILKAGKKAVKKVQVILKIGKKIFKAKTNAKGKATFKIKKLTKKGKYNAKITFKGNKLYKASSKKVKITVKK